MKKLAGDCQTLPGLLEKISEAFPGEKVIIPGAGSYSWNSIYGQSRSFARILLKSGISPGSRVLLLVPNSSEFLIAFYGVILSGAVPVPIFPETSLERCSQILHHCRGSHLVLKADDGAVRSAATSVWASEKGYKLHFVSNNHPIEEVSELPEILPDDTAFIQYTSGSTGLPKGIPLTHRNLLVNIEQMAEAMDVTSEDVFVSWLPVYHDMGLILNTMVPLFTGAQLILLQEGLHNPVAWLRSIEKYRGTFIAAPDTAYQMLSKLMNSGHRFDLSSLRVALNASEPVHAATCENFGKASGLKNVVVTGYGLAEATVAVTMHPPGQALVVDESGYVSAGKPLKGIDVIINPEPNNAGSSAAGEILVKSAALMKGYLYTDNSLQPFNGQGFLKTGDLGYLDKDKNLFVLSRKKNIIKHAGMTIYPDDVENAVSRVTGIRRAMAVGIASFLGEGERMFVFAEFEHGKCPDNEVCHKVAVEAVGKIYGYFGIRPARFILLKPKTLPRTPNGKLQYFKLKEAYVHQQPWLFERILYPVFRNYRHLIDGR